MNDTENTPISQEKSIDKRKKPIKLIRIPTSRHHKLKSIAKKTGKQLDTVNREIIDLGLEAYNKSIE